MNDLSVREINAYIRSRSSRPVIAVYVLDGLTSQGRIIRARTMEGKRQGLTLGTHRWADIVQAWVSK